MEQTTPVTHPPQTPPLGEFRLELPGATRPVSVRVTRTDHGASVVYVGRRWAGCLTLAGTFEGRPLGRVALDLLTSAHVRRVQRCGDCGRELTDEVSKARGVGPDCWVARGSA